MSQETNLQEQVDKTFEEMGDTSSEILKDNIQPSETVNNEEKPEVEQSPVENKEPENKEPENKEPENKEPENKEPESKDVENKEPESKDVENKEPENKEPENKEPENKEPENKDELLEQIKVLLKRANYYKYLNCGRFLKNGVDETSLKKFYNEFIKQGETATKSDDELIKLMDQYFA